MLNLTRVLADELGVQDWQVQHALQLFAEGGTVPFVARYRKEKTGGLDEIQLRALNDRHRYLTELEDRKAAILKSIDEQGRLTGDLRAAIEAAAQKAELEDLYLPYKPKRRTRATVAREKGLEPLADWIREQNAAGAAGVDLEAAAAPYVDDEKGVATPEEALQGAADILAEAVSERADLRAFLRDYLFKNGVFVSKIKDEYPAGTTQFETYRDFRAPARSIPAHNLLALRRGETEGVLYFNLEFDEAFVHDYLVQREIHTSDPAVVDFYRTLLADAFERLMKNTLVGEIRLHKKQEADAASIETFAANLRELLLASPAGMRPTLGVDPGFRTGCKLAVLDATGRLVEHATIYPHGSAHQRQEAARTVAALLRRHGVELVAVGNGTAGRETEQFVGEVLREMDAQQAPARVLVSEAGASVYSASEVAIEEFPDLDVTVRGAVSIGRRLQDPLAELVKIDPKSIGVGQYQHDVDQTLLRQKLEETVESCVNFVGVDLNTASKELLRFVAGITPALARNIVAHRDAHGAFAARGELMAVNRFGPKAFEQAAGFLRIRGGENPLDNTAVHPERYPVVEAMARDLGVAPAEIMRVPERLRQLDLKRYATDDVGEPTLRDILAELEKPGRDPRAAFEYATFRPDVTTIKDLQPGMVLEGVVTNVTNFGAFVDIGVHRDGLVHVSQLADRRVQSPTDVVKVGQVVKVRVVEVDEKLNRISLSMRSEPAPAAAPREKPAGRPEDRPKGGKPDGRAQGKTERRQPKQEESRYSLDDLKRKFNSR